MKLAIILVTCNGVRIRAHIIRYMNCSEAINNFKTFGKEGAPVVLLIPGLGVSYEIFHPLIDLLKDRFQVVAMEVDGFVIGTQTRFTSVDGQAGKAIDYIKKHHGGKICCAYGLSLGGKILSIILERDEVKIEHSIMDAAPLLPLPRWLVGPLRYLQAGNVWSCFYWTGYWRWLFRSHYFDVLLDECKKVYPFGGTRAVLDGYKSVYTNKLEYIPEGLDIHYWHGTLEAFVAKPQVKHLQKLCPGVKVEVFPKMNHGQMLVDHPEEIARRIADFL